MSIIASNVSTEEVEETEFQESHKCKFYDAINIHCLHTSFHSVVVVVDIIAARAELIWRW